MNMAGYQYGDLPQIPALLDEHQYNGWASHHSAYQQYQASTDEAYSSGHVAYDMMRVQAVQRYLVEPLPQSQSVLQSKMDRHMPLYSQQVERYEQWPAPYHHRYNSPDSTSISEVSSSGTQNELRSPHPYLSAPYGSPKEYMRAAYSYPSPEHLQEPTQVLQHPLADGNASISLRDIELEHPPEPEPEPAIEDAEPILLKNDVVYEQEPVGKMDAAPAMYKEYSDVNGSHSLRDGESVQPMEPSDEESSDTEYMPHRSSKQRRSSGSAGSSGLASARRRSNHGRNKSTAVTSTHRVSKRAGRTTAPYSSKATDNQTKRDSQRHFPCPLAIYGCPSTFQSKNEWKRHVSTQHMKLGFWRCNLCVTTVDPNDEHTIYHNDFNRKDLFTQHLRRMHTAPPNSSASRTQKEYPVNEDNIGEHQARCFHKLRSTPLRSQCLFCTERFVGPSSWESRMEHIARHLEKDRKEGSQLSDIKRWVEDSELDNWLLGEGIIEVDESGKWRIGNGRPNRFDHGSADEGVKDV